eukprot:SAG31_NODE_13244_length_883_cov_0.543367_1_plen_180_part_00
MAYARFVRDLYSIHDFNLAGVPADADIEVVTGANEYRDQAHDQFKVLQREMAVVLKEFDGKPDKRDHEIQKLKQKARQELQRMPGSERDAYASAWYTVMREQHAADLHVAARASGTNAALDENADDDDAGVSIICTQQNRPEAKLWINEIFGQEWSRIKARAKPPAELQWRRPARRRRY